MTRLCGWVEDRLKLRPVDLRVLIGGRLERTRIVWPRCHMIINHLCHSVVPTLLYNQPIWLRQKREKKRKKEKYLSEHNDVYVATPNETRANKEPRRLEALKAEFIRLCSN
jgi:hypothetical protein